jgi:Ca-activated chloride channel family protein
MRIRNLCTLSAVVFLAAAHGGSSQAAPTKRTVSRKRRVRLARAAMDRVMHKVDRAFSKKRGRASYGLSHRLPVKPLRGKKDKTLAPYFQRPNSNEKGIETLPLRATRAEVSIAGVIAQVKIEQVYQNRGTKPIEAVYVFPGSTRAAVHAMRMKAGKRIIEAKIKKRKAARQAYNRAKQQGKRASLLEQQRPNVFTMNVANIMPKDTIKVELEYSELLVPEDGVYSFVYPTVVGPRYGGGADAQSDRWIANPYLRQGKKPPYKFGLKVHLASPIGIKQLSSPSHKINVSYASKSEADVTLKRSGGGNRDFVLKYRLAGNKIETGVMTYTAHGEKFFLVMMEPPKRTKRKQIPPREYIFVVDVSGSMYGFPLNTSKALIKKLLANLKKTDYFNVVLFAGTSHMMHARSVRATPQNLRHAFNVIDRQRGGGGTELMAALKTAYAIPKRKRHISRSVVVITDGYVGVERQTFRFIRKNLGKVNCFAFGIGSSVNRGLIEGMARAGMGEPFVVLRPSEAATHAEKFRKYIQSPLLTEIKLAFDGVRVSDVVPKSPPDLLAKRPLIIFGKYSGRRGGKIRISGHTGTGRFRKTLAFGGGSGVTQSTAALRVLWARKWAEMLMDQLAMLPQNTDLKSAVTNLGLTYDLLTRFTSFVAIDKVRVRKNGKVVFVKQPLPLPKGVSNYAVKGRRRYRHRGSATGFLLGRASPSKRYSRSRSSHRPLPRAAHKHKNPLGGLGAADSASSRKTKDEKGKQVQVDVRSIANVKGRHKQRATRLLVSQIKKSACLAYALGKLSRKRVRVKITFTTKGKVSVSGGNPIVRACLQAILARFVRRLLKAKIRADARHKITFRLKLRLR